MKKNELLSNIYVRNIINVKCSKKKPQNIKKKEKKMYVLLNICSGICVTKHKT